MWQAGGRLNTIEQVMASDKEILQNFARQINARFDQADRNFEMIDGNFARVRVHLELVGKVLTQMAQKQGLAPPDLPEMR